MIFALAACAAAVMTWAHLRPRGAREAFDFPSLQHVRGLAARTRRIFPLEERPAFLLRLLALTLALAGVFLGSRAPVGPAAISESFATARTVQDASLWLGFDKDEPRAEGEGAAAALDRLRNCSDSLRDCLERAAGERELIYVPSAPPESPSKAAAPAAPVVKLTATSGTSRLWAAALSVAGTGSIEVADHAGSSPALIACDAPRPATADHPAVEAFASSGVVLRDPLDLAAGVAALPLASSLRFAPAAGFQELIGGFAVQRGQTIAVAATEEELGRWAHDGMLVPLARALLAAVGPVRVTQAPPGGLHRWSPDAPVGVRDVAPGSYLRDDGRVRLELSRALLLSTKELARAALQRPRALSWSTTLLGLSLLLWIAGLLTSSRSLPVKAVQLLAAALLALFVFDLSRPRLVQPEKPPPLSLVFDPQAPRVDLLQVSGNSPPLGSAAELWATVRVRRAAGCTVVVSASPASAPAARAELKIEGPDEVRLAKLPIAPTAAGVLAVELKAELAGAADSRVVSLQVREQPVRRLVLAAAPSWEARAVESALESLGDAPAASSTQLGRASLLTRGAPQRPQASLLDETETLVLVGFRDFPAQPVRALLERGGAVLFLDSARAAAAILDWPRAGDAGSALQLLKGSFDDALFSFHGYPSPRDAPRPLGARLLGKLGGEPWMVGRAAGNGRAVVVEAPDLFRVSPPSGQGDAYRQLLSRALGWAEAASAKPVVEVFPPSFATTARGQQRAGAMELHQPFLELEAGELDAVQARASMPQALREPLKLRKDLLAFLLLALLIALEAVVRRSARGDLRQQA